MKKILNSFIPLFVFSMCLTSCGDNASSSSIESFDSDSEAVVIEDIPNESFQIRMKVFQNTRVEPKRCLFLMVMFLL